MEGISSVQVGYNSFNGREMHFCEETIDLPNNFRSLISTVKRLLGAINQYLKLTI